MRARGSGRASPRGGLPDVLVVGPDERYRAVFERLLHDAGYCVLPAESGSAALAHLLDHPRHLVVLLDVAIDAKDGLPTTEALLSRSVHPPLNRHRFVVVSGGRREQVSAPIQDLIASLGLDVIRKPVEVRAFLESVSRAAGAVRARGGHGSASSVAHSATRGPKHPHMAP